VADIRVLLQNLRQFFSSYRPEILFSFRFLVILALLNGIYYLFAKTPVEDFILGTLTAKPPALIINFLTPAEKVVAAGNQITSQHVVFSIVSGCEGMGGILLIISAVSATSVKLRDKLIGLLEGVVFIYLLNILRIVGLYYVMRHYGNIFNFAHYFVGQTIIIILGCAFFVLWISRNMGKGGREATS
jgi:exosortase family protein XrtM